MEQTKHATPSGFEQHAEGAPRARGTPSENLSQTAGKPSTPCVHQATYAAAPENRTSQTRRHPGSRTQINRETSTYPKSKPALTGRVGQRVSPTWS